MLALPPVPPVVGWHHSTWLPRDYCVRLDANDYVVHPEVIGRRIEAAADLHRSEFAVMGGWLPITKVPGLRTQPSRSGSPGRGEGPS